MKNNHLLLMNHPFLYWGFMAIMMVIVNYYLSQFIVIQPSNKALETEQAIEINMTDELAKSRIEKGSYSSQEIDLYVKLTSANTLKSISQSKRTKLK